MGTGGYGERPEGATVEQVATPVPAVGEEAPDFTLRATGDQTITLSQYRGQKNVVLAFYVLDLTGG